MAESTTTEKVHLVRNIGGVSVDLHPLASEVDLVDKSVDYVNAIFDKMKVFFNPPANDLPADRRLRSLVLLQVAMKFIELRNTKESGVLTDKVELVISRIEQALAE